MQIRSDRRHAFSVSPTELWEALLRVDLYREWWPWLRHLDAGPLTPGSVWTAVVQPPVPYRLRFDVQIVEVVAATRVEAQITGDIAGSARLEIEGAPSGSELRLVSSLSPANRALALVAQVARPVVHFGHDWVLDAGLRQFRDRALP